MRVVVGYDGSGGSEVAAALVAADLVVLGTRGHTGLARVILGSTAREVLLATQASVLVAR